MDLAAALNGLGGRPIPEVMAGLNQVEEVIAALTEVPPKDARVGLWKALARLVGALGGEGADQMLARARTMQTASLVLQADLAAQEGVADLGALISLVQGCTGFMCAALAQLAPGGGVGEDMVGEVLQAAQICLQCVHDVATRLADRRPPPPFPPAFAPLPVVLCCCSPCPLPLTVYVCPSAVCLGSLEGLEGLCECIFSTFEQALSVASLGSTSAPDERFKQLDAMALGALKQFTELLDASIFPAVTAAAKEGGGGTGRGL